jgi:phage baseplate assembly protein W
MPQWTSGIHKLTQQFVKVLLTTPGTSLFRPDEGGGLQEMVGGAFSREEARVIASRAMLAVNRTTDQVKASQSRRGIPKAERLQTAIIEDVAFDPQTGGLNLKVLLRSEAGHITIANMGLSNAPAIGSGNMLPASAAGSA